MKQKRLISIIGILLILFLAACSGNSQEATSGDVEGDAETQSVVTSDAEVEIMDVSQLIVGTMMLADTDYPITPEQAKTLLPLWQLYQTMMGEDTTASQELDAVIKQIQRVFTAEQLTEIASIEYDDPFEMMDAMGIEPEEMSSVGSIDDLPEDIRQQIGDGNVIVMEGEFVGGGDMPGGAIGGFSGEDLGELGDLSDLDPEQLEEIQGQAGDMSSLQATMFLPALIEYLQEVAAS